MSKDWIPPQGQDRTLGIYPPQGIKGRVPVILPPVTPPPPPPSISRTVIGLIFWEKWADTAAWTNMNNVSQKNVSEGVLDLHVGSGSWNALAGIYKTVSLTMQVCLEARILYDSNRFSLGLCGGSPIDDNVACVSVQGSDFGDIIAGVWISRASGAASATWYKIRARFTTDGKLHYRIYADDDSTSKLNQANVAWTTDTRYAFIASDYGASAEIRCNWVKCMKSWIITVTGMPDGWYFKVKSNATVAGTSGASAGGSATLDLETATNRPPYDSIEVYDAGNTLITTLTDTDNVWCGDTYNYSSP